MKKIKLIIVLFALTIVNLSAQSLAGVKICINPGHGGHDSNDREIPLGNGITFWESDGNLSKGLYLKTMLESLGATVVMSRVTNTTNDDLPLSQIVAIANTNNVDYFHSIHSNATGTATKSNYTLILFQGRTTAPTYSGSLSMANLLADNILATNRTTRKMIAGDFDFYGTGQAYLGVFKGLNMPGTLSEGSFHDYTPESWRLKNESYLKHEAWGIARSFLPYFITENFKEGIIAGIVRNKLETVPASYNPLSGTNDIYKTINNVKVTLEPGGRTYSGDSYNNGYYFFDHVAPGNYKVIVEVDKMKPDTASVNVKENESIFSDRMMMLNPILEPPKVVSYSPADSLEVSNLSPIEINFDIRMSSAETEQAFSISPAVTGSFKWDTDFKKLTFTPSKSYTPGVRYTVKISTLAKTYFGYYLESEKSFSFTTRSKLKLVSIYPTNGAADISTTVLIRIVFDKGINGTTLPQRVLFTDSLGIAVPIKVNQSQYSLGIIEFEPLVPLKNDAVYQIVLKEGIGDVEFVYLNQTYNIEFRTENSFTYQGYVINGFESENGWVPPLTSTNTKGINTSLTSFSILNTKPKSGSYSGRLDYTFNGKEGVIDLSMINPFPLGESSGVEIGVWVFGDASNNILEYRFIRGATNIEKVIIDTLNWTGWRLEKVEMGKLKGSGTIQFKSINVIQTVNGSASGRIFFDDLVSNFIADNISDDNLPDVYQLAQNYPNPFNPETTIKYSVPAEALNAASMQNVSIKVYDILGGEVATLVNEVKAPGNYQVKFNARHLVRSREMASGIYIYRMQAGKFVASKKLMLLK